VDKGPPQKADTPAGGRRGGSGHEETPALQTAFDDDLSEELFSPQTKILVEPSL
jgi:hypothetical protein